jgi:cyclopropane-fatty-acyl-phospholipid synthase
MTLLAKMIGIGERLPLPDVITRAAIASLVGRTAREMRATENDADRAFAEAMAGYPIAMHVDAANAQHYELPEEFFARILGPQRKYSCCLYESGVGSLREAEERALAVTAEHAGLADGQRILELGCGWGALSLWMARHYRTARIVAVSNSHSQRAFISAVARAAGFSNLEVVTADMNGFVPAGRFDRVVSVEMFEHMANWRPLLRRVRDCLDPNGRMFMHVFTNVRAPYRFEVADEGDWIAQHFFTGGVMPSHDLIRQFGDCFTVENEWRWNGRNYALTAADWLRNFDRNTGPIRTILKQVYGRDARLWERRWRLFFLATMGLFAHSDGNEWGVSHYRLVPIAPGAGISGRERALPDKPV